MRQEEQRRHKRAQQREQRAARRRARATATTTAVDQIRRIERLGARHGEDNGARWAIGLQTAQKKRRSERVKREGTNEY